MAHAKWISGIGLLSFCAAAQLAWAKSPQITSVVFSPENKTLWMETSDGTDTAVMYLSAQAAQLVQGKMGKDAPTPPSNMPPGAIFEAWDAAQQVLVESQNTHPIAEQQALCDATIKLIAGEIGLQILRATKFAMASQSAPSTTLLAAIQKGPSAALPVESIAEGGNGGNPKHPIVSLVAEGGNGGNPKRPAGSVAEGGNGGNPKRPVGSVAEGGNGGNPKQPVGSVTNHAKEAPITMGGPVKSLPSRNF